MHEFYKSMSVQWQIRDGRRFERSALVSVLSTFLLVGCGALTTHEEQLFAKNSSLAIQKTESQAQTDLGCPQAKGLIVSKEIIEERQFHEVTRFNIKVSGCGKSAMYITRCDDEAKTLCKVVLCR